MPIRPIHSQTPMNNILAKPTISTPMKFMETYFHRNFQKTHFRTQDPDLETKII